MLQFFGKRLRYIQEVRREDRGFTLIELLVVIIIIGILAAIAIPAFLAQRERARVASVQSDLRNAAAAAQTCASTNNDDFNSPNNCASTAQLTANGYNQSAGVTVNTAQSWAADNAICLDGQHATVPGTADEFFYESNAGVVAVGNCPAAPAGAIGP